MGGFKVFFGLRDRPRCEPLPPPLLRFVFAATAKLSAGESLFGFGFLRFVFSRDSPRGLVGVVPGLISQELITVTLIRGRDLVSLACGERNFGTQIGPCISSCHFVLWFAAI